MNAPTDPDVPDATTYREVQEILRTFRESSWTGLTVSLHGMRIVVGKHGPPTGGAVAAAPVPSAVSLAPSSAPVTPPAPVAPAAPPAPAPPMSPADDVDLEGTVEVRSPAIGAFWTAPSPGQPNFVQVGQVVAQDEQLAIVEVMKLMNPVVTPVAGTVVQVCAANADLVEFEQVLFRIRPNDG